MVVGALPSLPFDIRSLCRYERRHVPDVRHTNHYQADLLLRGGPVVLTV